MFLLGQQKMTLCKPTMRFVSQILLGRPLLLEVPCQAFGTGLSRSEGSEGGLPGTRSGTWI